MHRDLRGLLWGCVLAAGCGSPGAGPRGGVPYLEDAAFRRADLEASLVNPANGYSQLRLAHYALDGASPGASATGSDWDRLPEWNPRVDPIGATELDRAGGASATALSANAAALARPEVVDSASAAALVTLGAAAFRRYPAQLAPYLDVALTSRASAGRYGLWVDDASGVGGLVRARMADGSGALALTCATCHATVRGGAIVPGTPNAQLDIGAAILAGGGAWGDAATASAIAAWGPGRLDVTTVAGTEPVRISDLRPVRWLTHLHHDATLAMRGVTTLAIRIETLIITSHDQALRPPRVIALALAAYVMSLADALPDRETAAAASPEGARVFAANCVGCHAAPALTGPPVPIDVVGTDPSLGRSANRGTGTYRVPSLHGVATRGPLLHDGTVPSLAAMFDPARPTVAFAERLHGSGAVPGHSFGLGLGEGERAALIGYLGAL